MSTAPFFPDSERTRAADDSQQSASANLSASLAPTGYELLAEIGRGGMGVVHRARDLSLDREVAVKSLHEQFAPNSTTAVRFLEEARITGQLQHPGIPAVHQVGMLPNGRPFLAMKLIKGETLHELLKARSHPASERGKFVSIFLSIAQALAYAHSHNVIHRDLKPANVMVGAFGEVQVMDWGLAKVLPADREKPKVITGSSPEFDTTIRSPRDSESNDSTQYGQFMGTPAFMPPEQAIGAIDQIDERSDVFGLGAILCAILTGKPPFGTGDAETTRQLAARGKVDEAFARLDACGADAELIAIAKSCLSPERADRPANAKQVAKAVVKHLAATEEKARRAEVDHAKRKVRTRAAAVVFTVLTTGAAVSAWQAIRATEANRRTNEQLVLTQAAEGKEREAKEDAEKQRAEAVEQRNIAKQQERLANERETAVLQEQLRSSIQSRFYREMLSLTLYAENDRTKQQKQSRSQTDIIRETTFQLVEEYKHRPDLVGRIFQDAGRAYLSVGAYSEAENALRTAFEKLRTHSPPEQLDRDDIIFDLVKLATLQQRYAEAESRLTRAKALFENEGGEVDFGALRCLEAMAELRGAQSRHADAAALYRKLASIQEKTNSDPRQALIPLGKAANSLRLLEQYDEAIPLLERVERETEKLYGLEHPRTYQTKNNLALAYNDAGRLTDAARVYQASLAGTTKLYGAEHDETLTTQLNYVGCLRSLMKYEEAQKLCEQILAIRTRRLGSLHPTTIYTMNFLGLIAQDRGNLTEATTWFEKVVTTTKSGVGRNDPEFTNYLDNLAAVYLDQNRADQAETALRESVAILRTRLDAQHPDILNHDLNIGVCLVVQARHREAERLLRQTLPAVRKVFGEKHFRTQSLKNYLAMCCESLGQHSEAEQLLRELLAHRTQQEPKAWTTANTRSRLGGTLAAEGKFDEATPLVLNSFTELKAKENEIPPLFRRWRLREAAERVVKLYDGLAKSEEAEKWRMILAEYREVAPPARVHSD